MTRASVEKWREIARETTTGRQCHLGLPAEPRFDAWHHEGVPRVSVLVKLRMIITFAAMAGDEPVMIPSSIMVRYYES